MLQIRKGLWTLNTLEDIIEKVFGQMQSPSDIIVLIPNPSAILEMLGATSRG